MTTLHRVWLANKIIIYTDIDMEPLAVEYPDGGGVANDGIGGDAIRNEIDLESDCDEDDEDDENDEEEAVEDVEIGARDEEQNAEGEDDDDDWLNEGLEGDEFGDDIFAA